MSRLLTEKKLVMATHNKGKAAEFASLFAPYGKEIVSAGELNLPEPVEDGTTFVANAAIKALAAAKASGLPALADDSGLCVRALDEAPGIHTARWCGPEKSPMVGMQRVYDELAARGATDFSAAFVCVLTLAWPDGHTETVEGRCEGTIVWPPRGTQGHGYDPFFMARTETRTFGEMSVEEKHIHSHRAKAFRALTKLLA